MFPVIIERDFCHDIVWMTMHEGYMTMNGFAQLPIRINIIDNYVNIS